MKFSTAKLLLTVATTTTMFGFLSAPVSAFMLNQVSASWDNVDLTKWSYDSSVQNWVSRDDGTVTAANPEKRVEFHSNGLDSKVLWGAPANHLNAKSGLGFTGLENLNLSVGEVFNIGTLRHYNHTISSSAPIGIQTDMSLILDFDASGIGRQIFDFELNIDETLNNASYHADGQCPYVTTGSGCSDAITWTNAIGSQSFSVDNQDYTLELVGFANSFNGDLVDRFVSQEQGISETNLYARLVKPEPQTVVPQEIPEPASLLGLGLCGAAIATRRRSAWAF
ncbi:MAG: THxN family PEP-CTERM protein [Chloroflexota bacterium]